MHGISIVLIISIFFLTSCFDENLITKSSENLDPFIPISFYPDRREDFSLWQLEAFNQEVQMAYVIRTDDNNIVVIDGGSKVTTEPIKKLVNQLGGVVEFWIVTHSHPDHTDALLEIIKKNDLSIRNIYHSELSEDWVEKHEINYYVNYLHYLKTLKMSGIRIHDLKTNDVMELGEGVELRVLGSKNEEIVLNAINNSSLVFKIQSKTKSIIFFGDLGIEGGNKLLQNTKILDLKADYVQMAHHGQAGVGKNIYQAVQARYALWPTPTWLWENHYEEGGLIRKEWGTLIVREWMYELNVEKNIVSGFGSVQID